MGLSGIIAYGWIEQKKSIWGFKDRKTGRGVPARPDKTGGGPPPIIIAHPAGFVKHFLKKNFRHFAQKLQNADFL